MVSTFPRITLPGVSTTAEARATVRAAVDAAKRAEAVTESNKAGYRALLNTRTDYAAPRRRAVSTEKRLAKVEKQRRRIDRAWMVVETADGYLVPLTPYTAMTVKATMAGAR